MTASTQLIDFLWRRSVWCSKSALFSFPPFLLHHWRWRIKLLPFHAGDLSTSTLARSYCERISTRRSGCSAPRICCMDEKDATWQRGLLADAGAGRRLDERAIYARHLLGDCRHAHEPSDVRYATTTVRPGPNRLWHGLYCRGLAHRRRWRTCSHGWQRAWPDVRAPDGQSNKRTTTSYISDYWLNMS
jgi:hypothetical protein